MIAPITPDDWATIAALATIAAIAAIILAAALLELRR